MRISDWSSDVCSSDLDVACQQTEARIDIGDEGLRELVDDVEVVHDGVPSDPVLLARRVGAAVAEIGRASCRERVCQVRVDLGGRRIIKKKNNLISQQPLST